MMCISKMILQSLERLSQTIARAGRAMRTVRRPRHAPTLARRVRSLKLTSMNNWQRRLAEDNAYGASLFPVHSIVDSMYGDRARYFTEASDLSAMQSAECGVEAIRLLFSPKPDRPTD
ncbi:MAG: hypothetical protein V1792_02845 [Pseudomonadota bacterium]